MKILYLECAMGASGDMLIAALAELLPDPEAFFRDLNDRTPACITVKTEPSMKCGVCGTHVSVRVEGHEEGEGHSHPSHHHHSDMVHIAHIVDHMSFSDKIKSDILAVYRRIAEAESAVHGVPVTDIHFHEVGALDAIVDIAAVCALLEILAPDEVVVSPVHVGSGQVCCAHGILPVPAPATARLLRDVPIYGGSIRGELCTPTGAALLTHFAHRFGDMPVMTTCAIGYGMGKKDFEAANCLRAFWGETASGTEEVLELRCNLDDMTGEQIGFAMERLLAVGALDVFTVPIGMKKSRPGSMLCVLCLTADREHLVSELFRHTTTLGIREAKMRRYVLDRQIEVAQTPYGKVRCKIARGFGVEHSKYEYEDLARIAVERNLNLEETTFYLSKT